MTFESTPPPTLGLGRQVVRLPGRLVTGLFSLARLPLRLLPGRGSEQEPVRRADVTILPSDLPIPSSDSMAAADAAEAIRGLLSADDVALMLAYERANAKRPSVIKAAMAAR